MHDTFNAERDSSNAAERKDHKAIHGRKEQFVEQERSQKAFSDRVNERRYGEVINQ